MKIMSSLQLAEEISVQGLTEECAVGSMLLAGTSSTELTGARRLYTATENRKRTMIRALRKRSAASFRTQASDPQVHT